LPKTRARSPPSAKKQRVLLQSEKLQPQGPGRAEARAAQEAAEAKRKADEGNQASGRVSRRERSTMKAEAEAAAAKAKAEADAAAAKAKHKRMP